MIADGYIRVSSKAQDHGMQREAIAAAAKLRGDTVRWHGEKQSGKTLARPVLDQVRAQARTGIVRRLYVWKLDRLTRSGVADTYKVIAELKAAGAELVAVADNLHLRAGVEDIATEAVIFALSLAARLERQAINERISAARARLEAKGRPWGRISRVSEEELSTIVYHRRVRCRSLRQIAVSMSIPLATVARAVRRADRLHPFETPSPRRATSPNRVPCR